jgi:hypothetical protein
MRSRPMHAYLDRLQTADQLAAILGDMELYGLGRDEVDDFFSRPHASTNRRTV